MFKTALACAVLALVSAQNLQDLANQGAAAIPQGVAVPQGQDLQNLATQANAALGPLLNQENPVVQHGDSLSLNVDNYEWTLTEQGGEYNLDVNQLSGNANNLVPSLSALLANVGNVAQNNNGAVESILDSEAANLGVDVESGSAVSNAAGQLNANSAAIGSLAESGYNSAASALASNSGNVADQANQQLNNQESLSSAVSSAVNAGVNGASNVDASSLPVQVNGVNGGDLANQAAAAAGNVNTNQAASQLQGLANQALDAGSNAANSNLQGSAAQAVNSAASSASQSSSSSIDAAASTLSANGVNNAQDAANLVNGQ